MSIHETPAPDRYAKHEEEEAGFDPVHAAAALVEALPHTIPAWGQVMLQLAVQIANDLRYLLDLAQAHERYSLAVDRTHARLVNWFNATVAAAAQRRKERGL